MIRPMVWVRKRWVEDVDYERSGPVGVLVAIGLEAGFAVREPPAAADDDEPDEVEGRNNGCDGDHKGKVAGVRAVRVDEGERNPEDDDLECGQGQSKEELGPAPEASAIVLTDAVEDEGELQNREEDPCHVGYSFGGQVGFFSAA